MKECSSRNQPVPVINDGITDPVLNLSRAESIDRVIFGVSEKRNLKPSPLLVPLFSEP